MKVPAPRVAPDEPSRCCATKHPCPEADQAELIRWIPELQASSGLTSAVRFASEQLSAGVEFFESAARPPSARLVLG